MASIARPKFDNPDGGSKAAEEMGRTKMAVVGLLFRGLKKLRHLLEDPRTE